ncbi:unnamed protein product, partial [Ectocarpus fasciculatus]
MGQRQSTAVKTVKSRMMWAAATKQRNVPNPVKEQTRHLQYIPCSESSVFYFKERRHLGSFPSLGKTKSYLGHREAKHATTTVRLIYDEGCTHFGDNVYRLLRHSYCTSVSLFLCCIRTPPPV